jgi:hypothetical protein
MNRLAVALLLGVFSILTITGCAVTVGCTSRKDKPPVDRPAAIRINTETAICSGTKLGPHTIITAAHCLNSTDKTLTVDGAPSIIEHIISDSNDHVLVVLSGITLTDFATLGPLPKEGDNIHFWGNPAALNMILRHGYVGGREETSLLYDVNSIMGDSGAGIFDDKKHMIGVISYVKILGPFSIMGSYPLNFTMQQIASAGILPIPYLMSGVKAHVELS